MVAQRSFEELGSDPDDFDQPESLIRRGDAASLVPVVSRDGSGVRLRRRARIASSSALGGAALPTRPGRAPRPGRRSAWRPRAQSQSPSRLPQQLSRVAGFGLALLVSAGFIFTVVRSGGDSAAEPSDVSALAMAEVAALPPDKGDTAISAESNAQAGVIPPPPSGSAPDSQAVVATPGPAIDAEAGSGAVSTVAIPLRVPFDATADAAPLGAPPALDIGPAAITIAAAGFDPAAAPSPPAGQPFTDYDLPLALAEWPGTIRYVVQPGDLLGSLALANRTTSAAIAGINDLTDPSHLRASETLLIPVGYVDPVVLPTVDPVAALLGWTRLSDHAVRDGDSLRTIAEAYFTTPSAIALFNRLDVAAAPAVGAQFVVPWGFTLDVSDTAFLTP